MKHCSLPWRCNALQVFSPEATGSLVLLVEHSDFFALNVTDRGLVQSPFQDFFFIYFFKGASLLYIITLGPFPDGRTVCIRCAAGLNHV